MGFRAASLPGAAPPGQDRWAITPTAAVVLDGATAFDPDAPSAADYVDALIAELGQRMNEPHDLRDVLRGAIAQVARHLDLHPGAAPSSTVLILREQDDMIELAVLGDSTTVIGHRDTPVERITDARIACVAARERRAYRQRLAGGSGYDDTHHDLLRQIQRAERLARNRSGGYWIAEADPPAADHAIIRRYPHHDLAWCVLATDGAQQGIDRLAIPWAAVAQRSEPQLSALLSDLQRWETEDPTAVQMPRAKPHDDKTLVLWTPTWCGP